VLNDYGGETELTLVLRLLQASQALLVLGLVLPVRFEVVDERRFCARVLLSCIPKYRGLSNANRRELW
jgi:hypothetical protein